jgi:hypothetical protein
MGKAKLLELQSRLGVRERPSEERLKTDVTFCFGLNRWPRQSLNVREDQRGQIKR